MKIKSLLTVALACLLAACGSNPKSTSTEDGLTIVDVETALENLEEELKMSAEFDSVRYVPLETNDSCLIGKNPYNVITDKYILVTYEEADAIYTFDKQTGRFLARIAHRGEGPQDYSVNQICYNEHDGLLYFLREPNQLQKYDPLGGYHGRIVLQGVTRASSNFTFTDSLIINSRFAMITPDEHILDIFNYRGEQVDSLIDPAVKANYEGGQILQLMMKSVGGNTLLWADYGNGRIWADIPYSNGTLDGVIKYRRAFCDTIYALRNGHLQPSVVFHTGKYHFPPEGRTRTTGVADKLLITSTAETTSHVFFYCSRNIYGDEPENFRGVYDRQTGITRLAPSKGGWKDDLTGFMTYTGRPHEAYKVVEWLAEHPEAKNNPALAPLLNIGEEDNPVAVVTSQKSEQ